jgi:hypothetical protein
MSIKRLAGLSVEALVVAGLACAVTGCGSGGQQVEVKPEQLTKTNEMLQNLGPQMKQKMQPGAAGKKGAAAASPKAP